MKVYIAIDIGNGNIKAALCDATGLPVAVRSERGASAQPSVCLLTADGKFLMGEDAREQALVHPDRAAADYKMELTNTEKKYFGGKATAVDVLSMVIKAIVALAEKQFRVKVDGVVATVPANLQDAARLAVRNAYQKAGGVNLVQIISEPAAACYAYAVKGKYGLDKEANILALDLGAGTFDSAIIHADKAEAKCIMTYGVPKLGGRDFSAALKAILLKQAGEQIGKAIKAEQLTPDQIAELEEKVEKAKVALSGQDSTKVAVHLGGKTRLIELTRVEFDAATQPLIKAMLDCTDKTMAAAKLTWKDLEAVILAGGPFNNPRYQAAVEKHTGIAPQIYTDLISTVSFGAAIHAQNLARKEGGHGVLGGTPQLTSTIDHDLGITVFDEEAPEAGFCSVVVPRGTPVTKVLTQRYRLLRATQTEVLIRVLQGEEGAPEGKCLVIGSGEMRGLPAEKERSERMEVTFAFDNDSLATVTVRDLLSGATKQLSVKVPANGDVAKRKGARA